MRPVSQRCFRQALLAVFLLSTSSVYASADSYFPCQSCHGESGEGSEALGAPAIAGMDGQYMSAQIRNFRDGIRGSSLDDLPGRQMSLVSAILQDDNQIDELASYVEAMPFSRPRVTLTVADASAEALYGACAVCHGRAGEGDSALGGPALYLLDDWYVLRQLKNFRDGIRGTNERDVPGMQMRASAAGLSDENIEALAAFIVTLRGAAKGAAEQ